MRRPLPAERPKWIQDTRAALGNSRLAAILSHRETVEGWLKEWEARKLRIVERQPAWTRLTDLLAVAAELPERIEIAKQAEAVRDSRLLLADPDPVRPLLDQLDTALRGALRRVQDACATESKRLYSEIEQYDSYGKLSDSDWIEIFQTAGIHRIQLFDETKDAVGESGLIEALRRRSLEHWESERLALPDRFRRAITEANRRLEPQAVSVRLPRRLLKTTEEVEHYLAELKTILLSEVSKNPVQVD